MIKEAEGNKLLRLELWPEHDLKNLACENKMIKEAEGNEWLRLELLPEHGPGHYAITYSTII